ncbi:hypothetical protein [Niabella drilacis]|uniref:Uncharacterized protein n=1 Tax=Niabella drilacis (strain DSM 25811 / CCM 8410 / CCUG 62505 / LMG 26954 / E90) TaxID=1285928 RepID=A0A1G6UV13_NIADE|nr:hypothetical protein [Niabella drilacis]SDD45094.1 hypothetical protein SAMN04487894_10997 [Niabella drilacis]
MNDPKFQQIQYECETWRRAVNFMIEESIIMKNRLSEILRTHFNKNLLEGIELLQNKLVRNDERIGIFRDDLTRLNESGAGKFSEQDEKLFEIRIRLLHNDLLLMEKQFAKLKSEFNHYLLEGIKRSGPQERES